MTPEISEFSYGFALTNEIVGWTNISAAPLFPSLIEEGKEGGGYDVKLEMPGIALYLQFKRADCMVRGTARELSEYGLPLLLPFYRFKITEARKSNQHELLRALAEDTDLVYYAAPRFHELSEINDAWATNRVAHRSIFIRPNDIGPLDSMSHHVAYDDTQAWLCSKPSEMRFLTAAGVLDDIEAKLRNEKKPLAERLPELIERADGARRKAEERIKERGSYQDYIDFVTDSDEKSLRREFGDAPKIRPPADLSPEQQALRKLSDDAAKTFSSQLLILQQNN